MKPICFIGARGGSKGVPRKNIRPILGKPLIAYTIESSLKSRIFSHVIVSTDDKEIAKIAKQYGAEVPFMRPKNLATDNIGFAPVLYHGIKKLHSLGYEFDVVVERDCTAPFIRNVDVKKAVKLFGRKKPHAVFSAYRQHFNPYFNMFEKNPNGFIKLCKYLNERPRTRQESPPVFQMSGFIVYDVKKFLRFKKIILPKIIPYEIPSETGIMIDTKLEFKIVELIIKNNLMKY